MDKNFEDFEVFIGNIEAHRDINDRFSSATSSTDTFLIAMEVVKLYHEWLSGEHDY